MWKLFVKDIQLAMYVSTLLTSHAPCKLLPMTASQFPNGPEDMIALQIDSCYQWQTGNCHLKIMQHLVQLQRDCICINIIFTVNTWVFQQTQNFSISKDFLQLYGSQLLRIYSHVCSQQWHAKIKGVYKSNRFFIVRK